ncbi:MAG TPA: glycosyl hydrolase [Mycobacteriales bacterium]|nr:glycosyl hydrolase [Mycobacteriales bacterium]
MKHRIPRLACALALLTLGVVGFGPSSTASAATCTLSAKEVPSCGVLWGAYKPQSGSETVLTAVTDLEAQVGRTFSLTYHYHDFSTTGPGVFPNKYEAQLAATGHVLLEDWVPKIFTTGATLEWSQVAAGKYDASVIDPEAERIKSFGKPVMLSIESEMDRDLTSTNTAAEFVAMYRHIHSQFASLGVTNVIWVWTITGGAGHDSLFSGLYPGSSYVDWIGYDPYNFATCHSAPWHTFAQTIATGYDWLEANGYGNKPFILPEYGTVPETGVPTGAASWFDGIPAALTSYPNIKALSEWDDSSNGCNTELTAAPGEMAAFTVAGWSSAVVG